MLVTEGSSCDGSREILREKVLLVFIARTLDLYTAHVQQNMKKLLAIERYFVLCL